MMGGFLIAWLVGISLSIVNETSTYRSLQGEKLDPASIKLNPLPPKPGRLLVASGVYVGLAILAESPSMRSTATLMAWGYNTALALKFATNYQAGKTLNISNTGTFFWNPPIASSDVLFPTGAGQTPTTPASLNTIGPGRSSSGPVVA